MRLSSQETEEIFNPRKQTRPLVCYMFTSLKTGSQKFVFRRQITSRFFFLDAEENLMSYLSHVKNIRR